MIIDRKTIPWIITSSAILVIATAIYIPYASRSLNGPHGGSFWGLAYGIAGSAMMAVVMLLALRKRLRTLRVGRTYWWMQAHVWLGLLSYPIIWYHAGFRWGGTLTTVMMIVFTVVIVTGIIGLALQNAIPSRMFREVQMETVYDQIPRIVEMIRTDADSRARAVIESGTSSEAFEMEFIPAGGVVATAAASSRKAPGVEVLDEFYHKHVRPFLHDQPTPDAKLSTTAKAELVFDQVRRMTPPALHEVVNDLQAAVEERRQLARQQQLHFWLHSWLIIHVPLSYALIIMAVFHAIYALRYTS